MDFYLTVGVRRSIEISILACTKVHHQSRTKLQIESIVGLLSNIESKSEPVYTH
jgi:hypothetical protein